MTYEEKREMARNSYYAQFEMLGYKPDGTPKDMVEVVRCKDCKFRQSRVSRIIDGKECNLCEMVKDYKPADWYCADGKPMIETNQESAENVHGLYCDDITFCWGPCDRTQCPRNSKNIRDKTVPHSYFAEGVVPDDCPKYKAKENR